MQTKNKEIKKEGRKDGRRRRKEGKGGWIVGLVRKQCKILYSKCHRRGTLSLFCQTMNRLDVI